MEKTKIIYLRTENMVNYYINVENYQLYTRSSPNSNSAAGVQLASFSGSIATILGIVSKGNNIFENPRNNLIILAIMWGIAIPSAILLSSLVIREKKKINMGEKLILKKKNIEDKGLLDRSYKASYLLSITFFAPMGMIIGSFYFVENGNMLFFICMILATMLSSLAVPFALNIPQRYKLLRKMKKEGIF
ncbi:hypothetical protein P7H90_02865 [Lactococcus lactis]|uniref:hypothetical protein n=1 Tax=Lactococcus TaxID=1357 RepID=UPI001292EE9C|nr:hypothetical protein [Lactococcus lactis]MDT2870228.1 hypothetical protein [Lactococcus lactis]MDT2891872.1 hypothetical protein [Lactococcus lactis]MDT2893676.1 hypothetical protein [Lactococcus lactis]MDT2913154.1 hypothetical protein [Lactococcus lactis]MDT2918227.1 hypothetical protein [Lactococcus lactis]